MTTQKIFKHSLLFLGLIVLIIFIFTIHPAEIIKSYSLLSHPILLILFTTFLAFLAVFVKAYRWRTLIHKITHLKTPLGFSFQSVLAGIAAGSFLPGRVELARPFMYKTEYDIPIAKSFSALVIERAIDLLCFLIFLIIGLLLIPPQTIISLKLVIIFISLICLCIILTIIFPKPLSAIFKKIIHLSPLPLKFKTKISEFLEHIIESFIIFRSHGTIISIAILSFITNGLEIVRFYFITTAFGIPVTIAILATTFSAGILLGVLSAIPGGLGVTEFSTSAILIALIPATLPTLAKSAVLLDRTVSYYIIILVGSYLLIHWGYFKKNKNNNASSNPQENNPSAMPQKQPEVF